jgi:ribosomal protein S18 acetylase RimI-like enzyme
VAQQPVSITLQDHADDAVRSAIAASLVAYNESLAGPSGHRPLVLALRNETGSLVGGLWGATSYGWLYTQMLAVPATLRGGGVGTRLMQDAEAEAVRRGCTHAWVDTQFGALGFYERLGYRVFGELPQYPPGFTRSFLTKALAPPA